MIDGYVSTASRSANIPSASPSIEHIAGGHSRYKVPNATAAAQVRLCSQRQQGNDSAASMTYEETGARPEKPRQALKDTSSRWIDSRRPSQNGSHPILWYPLPGDWTIRRQGPLSPTICRIGQQIVDSAILQIRPPTRRTVHAIALRLLVAICGRAVPLVMLVEIWLARRISSCK